MKMWIIYKESIGFLKVIAEMLQDRLDDYIDVDVGNAKKIEPSFLIEEKLDFLIIGDSISEKIPSLEIQNWLRRYREVSKEHHLTIKLLSGFYVILTDITVEPSWVEFLQNNVRAELVFPPILRLKLNGGDFNLEKGSSDLIKKYSKEFIEYFIK